MKKLVTIILLICTIALSFASCGNVSNNSTQPEKTPKEKTEELIDAITDADSCYEAAKSFYALTQEEQNDVYNKNYLTSSMKTYAKDTRIRDYLMKDSAAEKSEYFHQSIKKDLLNIDSYTVNSQTTVVFYDDKTNNYYLYIMVDYSAQNRAGGYNRNQLAEYYQWYDDHWTTLYSRDDEDWEIIQKMYQYQLPIYTRFDLTYTGK